jgi:MFS transporter
MGRLMDKANPHYVLGIAYASAGFFVFLIGHAAATPWLMVLAVFGAGFCVSGSQVGANALSVACYPTASRATGVSWANGVGRISSVLGSMLGGFMLSLGWGLPTVFGIVAIPAFIAGLVIFVMDSSAPPPRACNHRPDREKGWCPPPGSAWLSQGSGHADRRGISVTPPMCSTASCSSPADRPNVQSPARKPQFILWDPALAARRPVRRTMPSALRRACRRSRRQRHAPACRPTSPSRWRRRPAPPQACGGRG